MQVDRQHFLSTSLMQVVSTYCSKSVNIRIEEPELVHAAYVETLYLFVITILQYIIFI